MLFLIILNWLSNKNLWYGGLAIEKQHLQFLSRKAFCWQTGLMQCFEINPHIKVRPSRLNSDVKTSGNISVLVLSI